MRIRTDCYRLTKLVVVTTCFFLVIVSAAHAIDLKDLLAQKDASSKQLASQVDEYAKLYDEYQTAVEKRKQTDEELTALNERMKTLKSDLSTRAAGMYRQGPFRFLDLLFGSASFSEFATTWDLLRMINDKQAAAIDEMRALQIEQDALLKQYEESESAAQKLTEELEAQNAELKNKIAALDDSIAEMKRQAADAARLAEAEESRRLAQDTLDNQPYYPVPSYLGDGAWDATISSLLTKYGLPQSWLPTIRNIIWRESGNNPNAVGGGGAYVGLCQFGAHWSPPRGWSGTGDWRYDPVASIEKMVQYIADTGGLGNHWAATNY